MKSNTLILVIIAAFFAGGVYIWERQQNSPSQTAEESIGTDIFTFNEDEVERLTLTTPTQTLTFQKVTSGPSAWAMEQPKAGPADEAAVLFLINLLATARSQRTLEVPPTQKKEFGLVQPTTVEVTLNDKQTHTLVLGGKDFEGSSIYARVDPAKTEAQSWKVDLVPTSFLDAVSRPLKEWQLQSPNPTDTSKKAE